MPGRYLFGPVTAEYAEDHLASARRSGECLCFNSTGDADLTISADDAWDAVLSRLPAEWRPDYVVLDLDYTSIPAGFWSCPVPLIGLAPDWTLLWHGYRRWLRRCDLVFTDTPGVEALAREGIEHVQAGNLFGCSRPYADGPRPGQIRDIDLLFVGNVHAAVQRERLAWLPRLARLGEHWRFSIRTGTYGAPYRGLLARSRIVFNRSIRGECNQRAFEAAASGALLFQEEENRETRSYFRDRQECVYYNSDNLEELLTYYLEHEDERRQIADAALARAPLQQFDKLWAEIRQQLENGWTSVKERADRRAAAPPPVDLPGLCWEALSSTQPDRTLVPLLEAEVRRCPEVAILHNALGVAVALDAVHRHAPPPDTLADHFRRARDCEPQHAVAQYNYAEVLAAGGRTQEAIEQCRRTLAVLDRLKKEHHSFLDQPLFPPSFSLMRVEWEGAAWHHAGRPAEEVQVKANLLRWRLQALLAGLTGDVRHCYEACLLRPDLPTTRADLGKALAQSGHVHEAIPHLRQALTAHPFARETAQLLFEALGKSGDRAAQAALAHDRRLLARAAPQLVPQEPWFTQQTTASLAAATRPRVSLCLIVRDEEANLPDCMSSVRDLVNEMIVVDTGSTDRTRETAARLGAKVVDFPWTDSFADARNHSLQHASGEWIFWLDADDRVDELNRERLRTLFAGLNGDNVAYSMKVQSGGYGGGSARVVDHIRLFRNHPSIRWRYRVHEQILEAINRTGGKERWTEVVIRHVGYEDPAHCQRKHDRNLRLLELDRAEHPEDPFILFNLGWTHSALGRLTESLPFFQRSLELAKARYSFSRKLYALIATTHRRLGQGPAALEVCRRGLLLYPDDPELLYQQGLLLYEQGDPVNAETTLRMLLSTKAAPYFEIGVDQGLRGYLTRYNLGIICRDLGKTAEAETQWRATLEERPDYTPASVALAELWLAHGRWEEVAQTIRRLETDPRRTLDSTLLQARLHLARGETSAARVLLEQAVANAPWAPWPRLLLCQILAREGKDLEAEKLLGELLAIEPDHSQARQQLEALRQRRGRTLAAVS